MNLLLFYIGNGVLRCTLARTSSKEIPEVIFSEKLELINSEKVETKNLREELLRTLDKLAEDCRNKILKLNLPNKRIHKLFYIIASPWYFSKTKTLRTENPDGFIIKEDNINQLIDSLKDENQLEYASGVTSLEKKIIQISLNGYVTTEPFGKAAKKLEVSIVESFIEKDFLKSMKTIVDKYFQAKEDHFHSFSLASFLVLRNIFNQKEDFLLINVTSLLSEISLIKNGILYETITMPIGTQILLENLKVNLNLSTEAAVSVIRLYQDNQLEENLKNKVRESLEEHKSGWLPKLREVFSQLSLGLSLPTTCFFLLPPLFTGLSTFLLDSEEYSQFSFHDGKFKVESLLASSFQDYIKFSSSEMDPVVAIMALFASISKQ